MNRSSGTRTGAFGRPRWLGLVVGALLGLAPRLGGASGPAVELETPPLGEISAAWRDLARAALPARAEVWAPPIAIDVERAPVDGRRRARFSIDANGAGVWILPLRPELPAGTVGAWLEAHGAQPLLGATAQWHLPAGAANLEAACRKVDAWLVCQRPVGPEGPTALHAVLQRGLPDASPEASTGGWGGRLQPPRLADWVRREMVEAARRRARWLDAPARRDAVARGMTQARLWSDTLGEIREVSLVSEGSGASERLRVRVQFSEQAWPRVRDRFRSGGADPQLIGWSHTPALLQLWVNLEPGVAHAIMQRWLGQTVPGLRGDFGLLWLGIRGACDACGPRIDAWPALFPSAAAFKIGPPEGPSILAALESGRTSTTSARRVELSTAAGPTELVLERETVFVATGEGLGAAASRRWLRCDEVRPDPDQVLRARADLHAIRAALEVLEGRAAPAEVRALQRALEPLHAALGHRRWITLNVAPREARTLEIELRAYP